MWLQAHGASDQGYWQGGLCYVRDGAEIAHYVFYFEGVEAQVHIVNEDS